MLMHNFYFTFILLTTWPLRWIPYKGIHRLGSYLGAIAYHLLPKFKKRCLSNLSLASSLKLSEEQIRSLAKASMQNLMITCLEYAKLSSEKRIERIASCVNPEEAERLMKGGTPVLFFCGHQANWEILFLEGTSRMPGVAIGRPIKNAPLYNWVLKMRQKFGGKIIAPQNAIKEGLRGLKRGAFLGVVGDQGMPDSPYSSLFFGRTAWTSPIAAILSHRTGYPIIVATTKRREGKYEIHYSDPIWPNQEEKADKEIDRLMKLSLAHLEESIAEAPGEWLWSHNRWKQQTLEKIKRKFRQESILVILPKEKERFDLLAPHLKVFREVYPREFLTFYIPGEKMEHVQLEGVEKIPYEREEDLWKRDFRFKLVFNLSSFKTIKSHFKRLAAFEVVSLEELGDPQVDFSTLLKHAVLRDDAS